MPTLEYKKSFGKAKRQNWHKTLAYPEFTKFRELFSGWRSYISEGEKVVSERYPTVDGVSDFCTCHSADLEHSLHVAARPFVRRWIQGHMLSSECSPWSFMLTTREDGTLVIVKNTLATRWLALLDTEEMLAEIKMYEGDR